MSKTPEEITPELRELLSRASNSPTVSRPRRQPKEEIAGITLLEELQEQVKIEMKALGKEGVSLEESLYEERRNDRSLEPK